MNGSPSPDLLRVILEDEKTVFFLGAGASCSCGLPQGIPAAQTIVQAIVRRTKADSRTVGAIEKLALPWRNQWPAWPRFEVVVGLLARHIPEAPRMLMGTMLGKGRSSCHATLAALTPRPRIWLTTNFDDQIELSIVGQPVRKFVDRDAMRQVSAAGAEHQIVKLHGDASSRDLARDSVATIEQLLRAFPVTLTSHLVRTLSGRPLVFVGYSASDPDLIGLVTKLVRASPTVVWVGMGDPSVRIKSVLQNSANSYYLAGGFDRAIVHSLALPPVVREKSKAGWEVDLRNWVEGQPGIALRRFLADFLVEIGTNEARECALPLLSAAYRNPGSRFDRFTKRVDVLLKVTPRPTGRIVQETQRGLRALAGTATSEERIKWLARVAMVRQRIGDYSGALNVLTRARRIARRTASPAAQFVAYQAYGRLAVFSGGNLMQEGLDALKLARQLARRAKNPIGATDAAEERAIGLMRSDQAKAAERLLRACATVENEIGSPNRLVNWLLNLAESLRYQWRFDEASRLLDEARVIVQTTGDFEHLAKVTANTGLLELSAGRPAKAHQWMQECLALIRHKPIDEVAANVSYNQGWMRLLLGLWSEAIPFFKDAVAKYLKSAGPERAVGAYGCIGWCYLELGSLKSAEAQMRKVQRLRLTAAGVHKGEFAMLALFMEQMSDNDRFDRLTREMGAMHDMYFRGVAYLLANGEMSPRNARKAERLLVRAAAKAHLPFLLSRAEAILGRYRTVHLYGRELGCRRLAEYHRELESVAPSL